MSDGAPRVELRPVDLSAWTELSAGTQPTVCQTPQWLDFLRVSQGAEPVLAEVIVDAARSGFFTGALLRKAGFRILGSPLRGWTTGYMGFALSRPVPAPELLAALERFAFGVLNCRHIELLDRNLGANAAAGWTSRALSGYEIDLRRSETELELFDAMSPACRRCIRKAQNSGLLVEEVSNVSGYAHEYYHELVQVFAKQRLAPSYSRQRVEQLIAALHPQHMLLLLRARDASGRAVASALFPGYGRSMYFWGGASLQGSSLLLRPNEALVWYAMRWWKARGVETFDMGGGGAYKAKYGGTAISVPWLSRSSSPLVATLRWSAERALRLRQRFRRA
jgi:CelD/BcsL family acetyltransferase involved in cellulose biosynthesis